MASVQRKVAFYHLTQERTGDDHRKQVVSNANVEANFQHIYNQMTVLENQRRATKTLSGNVKFVQAQKTGLLRGVAVSSIYRPPKGGHLC